MSPWSRRREPLSAITGLLSAIDRIRVRDQSESLSAFAGIRIAFEDWIAHRGEAHDEGTLTLSPPGIGVGVVELFAVA